MKRKKIMNKPSKKVWRIIKNKSISENDHKTLRKSTFINDLFKLQWNRDKLPNNSKVQEPDFENIWDNIRKETRETSGKPVRKLFHEGLKYAAALVLLFLAFYAGSRIQPGNQKGLAMNQAFQNPPGVRSEIRLPDNSKIWLNSQSSIIYNADFGKENRIVILDGEAIFEVEKNEELPFIVKAGSSEIKALGTEFYVSAYPRYSYVSSGLMEGSIRIKVKNNNLILSDRKSISLSKTDGTVIHESELIPSFYEWKNGKLIFENTPLDQMAYRLSNWFGHKVKVDEKISDQRFTMSIENENIRDVLELIKLASSIEYRKTEDGYFIYPE